MYNERICRDFKSDDIIECSQVWLPVIIGLFYVLCFTCYLCQLWVLETNLTSVNNLLKNWLRLVSGWWLTNPKANSAFYPSGVGKWVPASAGKAKAGMVRSISGWTWGVQVKLWDPLRMRAIPERLRGVSWQGAIQIHVYLYLYPRYQLSMLCLHR